MNLPNFRMLVPKLPNLLSHFNRLLSRKVPKLLGSYRKLRFSIIITQIQQLQTIGCSEVETCTVSSNCSTYNMTGHRNVRIRLGHFTCSLLSTRFPGADNIELRIIFWDSVLIYIPLDTELQRSDNVCARALGGLSF